MGCEMYCYHLYSIWIEIQARQLIQSKGNDLKWIWMIIRLFLCPSLRPEYPFAPLHFTAPPHSAIIPPMISEDIRLVAMEPGFGTVRVVRTVRVVEEGCPHTCLRRCENVSDKKRQLAGMCLDAKSRLHFLSVQAGETDDFGAGTIRLKMGHSHTGRLWNRRLTGAQ